MENVELGTTVFSVLDDFPPPVLWTESSHDQSSGPAVDGTSASDDLPSCLVDKSQISLLQELCMKRGFTPHYELIDSEGPVHQRVFTYRATAGSFAATGKGYRLCFVQFCS